MYYLILFVTKEYIKVIVSEEILHGQNSAYVKSRASRGQNAGTWMHPLLFIDFAMWLNPKFKLNVIEFVSDELIRYRNEAGDTYKALSAAIYPLVGKADMPKTMASIAKAMNFVVYNNHEAQLRNKQADELLLKELCELQKDITKLINFGFINSIDQIKNFLRKQWQNKWNPNALIA